MNFCNVIMEPKILCSSLQSDGFEVENLTSGEKKGFQAERFSRTPVFITVQFSIPIQLKCILITPYMGRQCAKVVQVYILHCRDPPTGRVIDADEVTYRAGRVELIQPTRICFRNKHYHCRRNVPNSPIIPDRVTSVDLQGRLYNVIAIKIGLLAMLQGTVASVAQLEVWGSPSNACEKKTAQKWLNKWNELHMRTVKLQESEAARKVECQIVVDNSSDAQSEEKIPTDFLDPIMFTLMQNPVLLPSGQTVDQSTLNKHLLTQSEWGRPPSDPFTGVSFTEKYQPVPNLSLKLKIDKYVMSKSPATSNGECSQLLNAKNSSKILEPCQSRKRKLSNEINSNSVAMKSSPSTDVEITNEINPSKHRLIQVEQHDINPLYCSSCQTYFSLLSSHYTLPCRHKLCRSCLLSATTTHTCLVCHVTFMHDQVCRTFG